MTTRHRKNHLERLSRITLGDGSRCYPLQAPSARFIWSVNNVYGRPVPIYPGETEIVVRSGGDKVRLLGRHRRSGGSARLEVGLRAGTRPGEVVLAVCEGTSQKEYRLQLLAVDGDRDCDGMPDVVELVDRSDRQAFSAWFTAVAEAQFFAPDPRWERVHQDCAGLTRFAYKEALRRHDRVWLSRAPYLHHFANQDVRRYHYPEVPVLGEKVFRVAPGCYRSEDNVSRDFSTSASAQVLWEHNTVFITREIERAREGDLLFFRDPERSNSPMHTMILIDPPDRGSNRRVIYHTGWISAPSEVSRQGEEEEPGEVRMVTIADLSNHRDDRWRARSDNPYFLGFHRWKILEGGQP